MRKLMEPHHWIETDVAIHIKSNCYTKKNQMVEHPRSYWALRATRTQSPYLLLLRWI